MINLLFNCTSYNKFMLMLNTLNKKEQSKLIEKEINNICYNININTQEQQEELEKYKSYNRGLFDKKSYNVMFGGLIEYKAKDVIEQFGAKFKFLNSQGRYINLNHPKNFCLPDAIIYSELMNNNICIDIKHCTIVKVTLDKNTLFLTNTGITKRKLLEMNSFYIKKVKNHNKFSYIMLICTEILDNNSKIINIYKKLFHKYPINFLDTIFLYQVQDLFLKEQDDFLSLNNEKIEEDNYILNTELKNKEYIQMKDYIYLPYYEEQLALNINSKSCFTLEQFIMQKVRRVN